MTKFYNPFITLIGILVFAGGGLAQGKHGGGGKQGGDDGDRGRGQENRPQQRGGDDRGDKGDRGNRGGDNNSGGKHGDDNQRVYQQQQQQNDRNLREQQRQNEWNARREQQQNDRNARQQQQNQQQQQVLSQDWKNRRKDGKRDDRDDQGRGNHYGWNDVKNGGNGYGNNGYWPGQFPEWRDKDKRERKLEKRNRRASEYYYSDPISNYLPLYQQPNYGYNAYDGSRQPSYRENFVRSIISSFFAPQSTQYDRYSPAQSYQGYSPAYSRYEQYSASNYPTSYYSQAAYSPGYGTPNYNQGYAPYNSYGSPLGSQLFGGGGLKSTILNIGLQLLQGFLGQGYAQGADQGQYTRNVYGSGSNIYYDPYAVAEPAYNSPLASSFSDQRQLLQEGYRLGYQDAMRDRNPYGTEPQGNNAVNLISQFLASSLLNRI